LQKGGPKERLEKKRKGWYLGGRSNRWLKRKKKKKKIRDVGKKIILLQKGAESEEGGKLEKAWQGRAYASLFHCTRGDDGESYSIGSR